MKPIERQQPDRQASRRHPRFFSAVRYDILFQWRHGFYFVYLIFCIIYVGALLPVPDHFKKQILPLILFTDPAVLGYFFIGGIMLLEREQGIHASLFVSPYTPLEYILSKVCSFLLLSVATCFLIALPLLKSEVRLGLLCFAVMLTAPLFTLIGIAVGSRTRVLNQYLLTSVFVMPVFFLPLLHTFDIISDPLWRRLLWVIPTTASITLLQAAVGGSVSTELIWRSSLYLLAFTVGTGYMTLRWFRKHIIERIGEGR